MTRARLLRGGVMIEHLLPLWSGEGSDSKASSIEKFDIKGGADRLAPRRVRVQARQIYCSGKPFNWAGGQKAREITMRGLDYLLAKAKALMAGLAILI